MGRFQNKIRFSSKQILSTLEDQQTVLSKMGVKKIGLFGSYRRGTPRLDSDMDFLVVLDKPTFDTYMNVKIFLEDLFDCKVDLVMEETIKPRLRQYIQDEVLYAQGL